MLLLGILIGLALAALWAQVRALMEEWTADDQHPVLPCTNAQARLIVECLDYTDRYGQPYGYDTGDILRALFGDEVETRLRSHIKRTLDATERNERGIT